MSVDGVFDGIALALSSCQWRASCVRYESLSMDALEFSFKEKPLMLLLHLGRGEMP
jgi:hypothetical protein